MVMPPHGRLISSITPIPAAHDDGDSPSQALFRCLEQIRAPPSVMGAAIGHVPPLGVY